MFVAEPTLLNLRRLFVFVRQLTKKYLYTINHRRLGLNYFYFSLLTGMSGAILATAIRFEMAYPGSPFFGGDSLRYLQVITAHALIMIFFVVVPIFFGGFANFLLPSHVGSKDVAFPRLNSLGFWIQPCGYLLIAKIGFLRTLCWKNYQVTEHHDLVMDSTIFARSWKINENKRWAELDLIKNMNIPSTHYGQRVRTDLYSQSGARSLYSKYMSEITIKLSTKELKLSDPEIFSLLKKEQVVELFKLLSKKWNYTDKEPVFVSDKNYQLGNIIEKSALRQINNRQDIGTKFFPVASYYILDTYFSYFSKDARKAWKLYFWKYIHNIPDTFHFLITNAKRAKSRKRQVVKCSNALQTVAGWTFITPFSSDLRYTGPGVQDMLILGVYYAGISTTISVFNLLATRRTLAIPGLRNRRILLPFISISILLMLRALFVITPVLGSAMLMLALDRHWQTSFFDFAYGGDPIFFHHLFWFFGHPEVYVLVIPAFGVINSVLPALNFRRLASKHHLIWAVYIMNYMGFLVWGHHMYLIGLDHRSRALYSTITIMISMPATIKVVNWTFTLITGSLKNDLVFMSVVSFIAFFLVAGLTGMWLSHVSLNISMHDTLYVVAHFHLMLSGAVVMGIFTGFYFYFPTFFQIKFSRTFGFIHIIMYTAGQWLTFLPMFWVSFSGLPRRLHDFPAIYMGWQGMSTVGHLVTMVGVLGFYFMLLDSKLEKKIVTQLSNLLPRFNKKATFHVGSVLNSLINIKYHNFVPTWYSRRVLSLI